MFENGDIMGSFSCSHGETETIGYDWSLSFSAGSTATADVFHYVILCLFRLEEGSGICSLKRKVSDFIARGIHQWKPPECLHSLWMIMPIQLTIHALCWDGSFLREKGCVVRSHDWPCLHGDITFPSREGQQTFLFWNTSTVFFSNRHSAYVLLGLSST